MSGKIMGQVWDLQLPHNKLIVLLAMADHAHHDGSNVYPSVGLVAWKTGYSDRSVRRIIKSLVEDGILICVEERQGYVKKYQINLSAGVEKEPYSQDSNTDSTPDKISEVSNSTPDTAMSPHSRHIHVIPPPDTAMSPKPSVKPSVETTTSVPDKPTEQKAVVVDVDFKEVVEAYTAVMGAQSGDVQAIHVIYEDYPKQLWLDAIQVLHTERKKQSIKSNFAFLKGVLRNKLIDHRKRDDVAKAAKEQTDKSHDRLMQDFLKTQARVAALRKQKELEEAS